MTFQIEVQKPSNAIGFPESFLHLLEIPVVNSFGVIFLNFLIPYLNLYYFSSSPLLLGMAISVQLIGSALTSSFVAKLRRKFFLKNLIFVGSLGNGFGLLIIFLSILAISPIMLIVGVFLVGISIQMIKIPLDIYIAENIPLIYRSQAYGMRMKWGGYGLMLGTLISGILFVLGIKYLPHFTIFSFISLCLFGLVDMITGLSFLNSRSKSIYEKKPPYLPLSGINSTHGKTSSSRSTFSLRTGFFLLLIVFFLFGINQNLARPFLQILISENISMNSLVVFAITIPAQIMSMIIAPKISKFTEKLPPVLAVIMLCTLGALATWFLVLTTSPLIFALILLFDAALAYSGSLILKNYIATALNQDNITHLFSLLSISSILGLLIGPLIGAFLVDQLNTRIPFEISIFIEIILIIPYACALKFLKPLINKKKQEEVVLNHQEDKILYGKKISMNEIDHNNRLSRIEVIDRQEVIGYAEDLEIKVDLDTKEDL